MAETSFSSDPLAERANKMKNILRYALWILAGGGLGFGAYYALNVGFGKSSTEEKP